MLCKGNDFIATEEYDYTGTAEINQYFNFIGDNLNLHIDYSGYKDSRYNGSYKVSVILDGTEIYTTDYITVSKSDVINLNQNITPGVHSLRVNGWNYGSTGYVSKLYTTVISKKTIETKTGKPREIKTLGNKTTITLFGNHIDNSFIHDYPNLDNYIQHKEDEYSTNTFDITAYKGYIYITFGGHKYKVPYTDRTDIE